MAVLSHRIYLEITLDYLFLGFVWKGVACFGLLERLTSGGIRDPLRQKNARDEHQRIGCLQKYGKSQCLFCKLSISMAMFNSKLLNCRRANHILCQHETPMKCPTVSTSQWLIIPFLSRDSRVQSCSIPMLVSYPLVIV